MLPVAMLHGALCPVGTQRIITVLQNPADQTPCHLLSMLSVRTQYYVGRAWYSTIVT